MLQSDFRLGRMVTFLGAMRDPLFGLGLSSSIGVGVDAGTAMTFSVTGETESAAVYGSGRVVFAETTDSPEVHFSQTSLNETDLQLDVLNVEVRWFGAGSAFLLSPAIADGPARGGTDAVVSIINGNVVLVSGTLPPDDYPQL